MRVKYLIVLASSLTFTACQPPAPPPLSVQNTQPTPTISVRTAPSVSVSENENSIKTSDAAVKNSNQPARPSPNVSTTPKLPVSPSVTPAASIAPKFKNYKAKGIVKEINLAENSIVIDHEDIGDYMVGMKMPFPVVDKNILKNLKVGDKIDFVLETGVGVERIVSIRKK